VSQMNARFQIQVRSHLRQLILLEVEGFCLMFYKTLPSDVSLSGGDNAGATFGGTTLLKI